MPKGKRSRFRRCHIVLYGLLLFAAVSLWYVLNPRSSIWHRFINHVAISEKRLLRQIGPLLEEERLNGQGMSSFTDSDELQSLIAEDAASSNVWDSVGGMLIRNVGLPENPHRGFYGKLAQRVVPMLGQELQGGQATSIEHVPFAGPIRGGEHARVLLFIIPNRLGQVNRVSTLASCGRCKEGEFHDSNLYCGEEGNGDEDYNGWEFFSIAASLWTRANLKDEDGFSRIAESVEPDKVYLCQGLSSDIRLSGQQLELMAKALKEHHFTAADRQGQRGQ